MRTIRLTSVRSLALLVAGAAAASPAAIQAQACQFLPSDTPTTGTADPRPFGNGNGSDPTYGDMRYQIQIPAAALGNQPLEINELFVAPAGAHTRTFTDLQVRMGHNPNPLGPGMGFNTVGFTSRPVQQRFLTLDAGQDQWLPLGMMFAFQFNPAYGDLVIEFFVNDAAVLPGGTGNIGLRTDPSIPFVWTSGQGYNGTIVPGGGIKLKLCTDHYGTIEYGMGGCVGSNGLRPKLSYGGSAQVGSTLQIQLDQAPAAASSLAFLVFSDEPRTGPFDLTAIGMTGCDARVFGQVITTEVISGGSHAAPLAIPNGLPSGIRFWNQWFCLDLPANPLGLTASNLGRFQAGYQ